MFHFCSIIEMHKQLSEARHGPHAQGGWTMYDTGESGCAVPVRAGMVSKLATGVSAQDELRSVMSRRDCDGSVFRVQGLGVSERAHEAKGGPPQVREASCATTALHDQS